MSIWAVFSFVIGLIVSTIIIYFVTKIFGEREGIKAALATAIIGAIIYSVVYYLFGNGLLAGIAGAGMVVVLEMDLQNRLAESHTDWGNYLDNNFYCWSIVTNSSRTPINR